MEKAFNKKTVEEITRMILETLTEQFKSVAPLDFTVSGGRFTSDKLRLNLEVRMKDESGALVVTASTHSAADRAAEANYVKVKGHLIGSMWKSKDKYYLVTGYNSRRPKYPIALRNLWNNSTSKANYYFLRDAKQIVPPSKEDFVKWFTLDPDDDAILESDAEICDNVQEYIENFFTEDYGYLEQVDRLNEIGVAKKYAKTSYDTLFGKGIEAAAKELKKIKK